MCVQERRKLTVAKWWKRSHCREHEWWPWQRDASNMISLSSYTSVAPRWHSGWPWWDRAQDRLKCPDDAAVSRPVLSGPYTRTVDAARSWSSRQVAIGSDRSWRRGTGARRGTGTGLFKSVLHVLEIWATSSTVNFIGKCSSSQYSMFDGHRGTLFDRWPRSDSKSNLLAKRIKCYNDTGPT